MGISRGALRETHCLFSFDSLALSGAVARWRRHRLRVYECTAAATQPRAAGGLTAEHAKRPLQHGAAVAIRQC